MPSACRAPSQRRQTAPHSPASRARRAGCQAELRPSIGSNGGIRSSITKMRTNIPQNLIDYGNSRKVTCGGDHYFYSDSWVGLFTIEGDRTCTSKLYRCGDVEVSTSRKSRFMRSWPSSSRLCRSTFQPEGQRVTRLRMCIPPCAWRPLRRRISALSITSFLKKQWYGRASPEGV